VPSPVTLNFQADASATAKYRLEAISGDQKKTQDLDVSSAVPPLNIAF